MPLKTGRLLLSIVFVFTLSACDKAEPVEPYTPPAPEVNSLFDQFDSSYSGIAYWDLKKSRDNPDYETIQNQIVPFLQSSEFTGKLSDGFLYLDSVGVDISSDIDYAVAAVYAKPDSGYKFAVVLEGRIPVSRWKKALTEFKKEGENTVFDWFRTQSGQYWVSFPKENRVILTTERSLINYTSGNGDLLVSELARECASIPQQSEAFFYFKELGKTTRIDFGDPGSSHAVIDGEGLKQVYAGMYFRDKIVIRGQADMSSSSGVFTSSVFIKAALNFISMKAFFSNETVLTDFIKVDSRDSSIVLKADIPVSALSEVNKIGIEK